MDGWALAQIEQSRDDAAAAIGEAEEARAIVASEGLEGWEGPAARSARTRLVEARIVVGEALLALEGALAAAEAEIVTREAVLAAAAASGGSR